MPKGVECPHAGYVNLALSYAEYFDLLPGMDATSLTSSLGYDGSISEMYCAWVSGCTVVMLTKEQIRSGPDLVPVLRDADEMSLASVEDTIRDYGLRAKAGKRVIILERHFKPGGFTHTVKRQNY